MKTIAKKIFPSLPLSFRRFLYGLYEDYFTWVSEWRDRRELKRVFSAIVPPKIKQRLLFYHISGMSFGGSEKFLQIMAKHLNKEKFEIYFMYSPQMRDDRRDYLKESGIIFLPFSFKSRSSDYPFYIEEMSPSLPDIIEKYKIDLLITAGTGYVEHPVNLVKNIPILMINIFGAPSLRENIKKHLAISQEVKNKMMPLVATEKIEVMHIPTDRPMESSSKMASELRESLGFKETDLVFGRIGRADDGIFDAIGIEAFKKVVKKYPEAKYLIQSPPPILAKKVKDEGVPNVYFMEPSGKEEEIWTFHFAVDALAHFRHDGESCGLNIIEAMAAGKPIISHRSPIWNAHLEYLQPSFSRVVEENNSAQYAKSMEEFILLKKAGRLEALGEAARAKAREFLIENNLSRFEKWIDEALIK